MFNMFLGLTTLLLTISLSSSEPVQAKRYKLNLDLPPKQRWLEIAKDYKGLGSALVKDINDFFPPYLLPILQKIVLYADDHFPAPYPDEMRGYAKGLNVSFTDIVMTNLFYDLTSFCTSIVAQDKAGNIYHGRNFDYYFVEHLRKATLMVDYQRQGKTVYTGALVVGQVGLPTGQRPNAFTLTSNERDKGSLLENIIMAIFDKKALPHTFLTRNVLAEDNMDFDTAIAKLSQEPIIADVYFIVGGVKPGQGAVITRNKWNTADVWSLDSPGRWFLVQTNYDHWTTPPPGDDRRDPAIKAMSKIGRDNVNLMALFKVLSIKPVMNNETIFTTVMQAKDPEAFNTWIRYP